LLLLAIFALGTLLLWRIEKREKPRQIERAFAGRTPLSEETFYDKYFKAQGIPAYVVIGVRDAMEECIEADLSRLSDEDDFSKNLRFFCQYDSLADLILITALEKKFDIDLPGEETREAATVRQIIEMVWEKVRGKAAGPRTDASPEQR
jgi:acyl carrier protein